MYVESDSGIRYPSILSEETDAKDDLHSAPGGPAARRRWHPVVRVQPAALNLGLTDILDGALPGPGTYFTEYIQAYQSGNFKDPGGNSIPGTRTSPTCFR